MDKSVSEKLQGSIVVYSAIGALAMGIIIALVSIVPLFNNLKEKIDKNLLFAVKTRTLAVEEHLSKAKDIALQVTSRTRIRDYLKAYSQGGIGLDDLVDFTAPKLVDAMNLSKEMEGICRLDYKDSLVVQVGLPIPEEFWQAAHGESKEALIYDPIVLGGKSYFIVKAPIFDRQSRRIGTDILLFKLTRLQQIIKDYTGLGETEETVLGAINNDRVQLFFPLRGSKEATPENFSMDSPLGTAFLKAVHQETGILKSSGSIEVIAYSPVQGSNWGILIKMHKKELYAPVNHQIIIISGIIGVLLLIGICVMVALLRPLTGRIIVLEQAIQAKTILLEGELNEHKRTEDHLQYIQSILKAIRDVNQLIVREKNQKKLLQGVCKILNQTRGYRMVWIGLVNNENKDVLPVAQAGFEKGYLNSVKITWDDSKTGKGPTGKAIKTRKFCVMRDIGKDPLYKPWQKEAIERGYGSSAAIPLVCDDRTFGALNVYAGICDAFDKEEMDLLLEVGHDIALALKTLEIKEEIKETKEFLQNIIDNTSDLVCTVDLEGRFLSINRAVTELLGYKEEDLIGKSKIDLAVDPELFMNIFREVLEKGSLSNLEVSFKKKDGTIADILYSVTLLTDKDGHPVALAGFGKDITERKRVMESLRKSEEHLRKVLDGLGPYMLVGVMTPDGTLIEANRPALEIAGLKAEDVLKKPFEETYWWSYSKPAKQKLRNAIREAAEGKSCRYDVDMRIGENRFTTIDFCLHPLVDEAGKIIYLIPSGIDITERKQAEQALQKAYDELEDKVAERTRELALANVQLKEMDRLKSEFIATMSHELRTPLNSIIGFTGIILKGIAGKINDEQRKQLSMVYKSAKHLLNLINDILDLSRIESGKMETSVEKFKIKEIICKAIQTLSPMIYQKNLILVKKIPDDLPEIYSDRKKVFQIFLNLINNAVKFTDKGKIKIECKIENDYLEVCVSDTGIGMKKGNMDYLFEAFRQIDGTAQRRYEGAGLGLYLCKNLVTILGGKIWAESEYGKGSRFTFTLPLKI